MRLCSVLLVIISVSIGVWVNSFPRWELALTAGFLKTVNNIGAVSCWAKNGGQPCAEERLVYGRRVASAPFCAASHDISRTTYTTTDGAKLEMGIGVPKNHTGGKLPIIFEIHGGGWTLGNFNQTMISAYVSPFFKFVLFSPQYRLAPEHQFPTAVNDAYDALLWVRDNAEKYGGDLSQLIIAGVSAGGNLAAVTAVQARDRAKTDKKTPKIAAQLLHVPATTISLASGATKSVIRNLGDPIISPATIMVMRNGYVPNLKDWTDPRVAPIYTESLENLPPAFIISNTYDPIYDDALAYRDRLKQAKVDVEHYNYDSYHAGELIANYIFGVYKSEIQDMGVKCAKFLTRVLSGQKK